MVKSLPKGGLSRVPREQRPTERALGDVTAHIGQTGQLDQSMGDPECHTQECGLNCLVHTSESQGPVETDRWAALSRLRFCGPGLGPGARISNRCPSVATAGPLQTLDEPLC